MMGENRRVELLAPAGNAEGFYGAIHAGADAVYLGGERFGARAYADNFTTQELVECIRYAHLWRRRVYLTVNTLVKESEFPELYDYLRPFYEAGLDGVIVQDVGVLGLVRECFPELSLHASTQMTITGRYGARLLKGMGVSRVVPARELSLRELIRLKEDTGLEVEAFVHGSMCYCYSGQCLFSSILGGRSGNRGRCAQPCRLPYRMEYQGGRTKECYPLSLKDLCTIEHIPELIEAGIDSFKIEGRMKKPEYAAGVTAIYRKYIDAYYREGKRNVSEEDIRRLSHLYLRSGLQDGYYQKQNGRDMVTLDSPGYSGSDEELLRFIRAEYLEKRPRMPVGIEADFRVGSKASVTYRLGELAVTVEGETVEAAQKAPITADNVEKQLCRLGESIFCREEGPLKISLDGNAFYPLKAINALRREAVDRLSDQWIAQNGFPVSRDSASGAGRAAVRHTASPGRAEGSNGKCPKGSPGAGWVLSAGTLGQLRAISRQCAAGFPAERIYVNGDILLEAAGVRDGGRGAQEALGLCSLLAGGRELVIAMPYILRYGDGDYLEQIYRLWEEYPAVFGGFQVRSLEGLGFLREKKYPGNIYGDASLYFWNKRTLEEWRGILAGFCLPLELKGGEQRALLTGALRWEKLVYGRIPMMITANCVIKTLVGCRKGKPGGPVELVDRCQKHFPVTVDCGHCMNIIYNSLPLSLHGELPKWEGRVQLRLDFTLESETGTGKIMDFFAMSRNGAGGMALPYPEYTTGHEKRGVD